MKPIGIAEARRRLPELAARVARDGGGVIVIENQRRGEREVLTADSYLRGLEAMVEEAKKQGGGAFELAGSITSGGRSASRGGWASSSSTSVGT